MSAEAVDPNGPIVIIGAGQAGLVAAESLRAGSHLGAITLLGQEAHAPYHRPPLSKAWLAGEMSGAQLGMRAPAMLARKGIDLRVNAEVVAVDRSQRSVQLAGGEVLPYAGLVLATGASARRLPGLDASARNVHTLRTLEDASRVAEGLAACAGAARPLVVIGGGFVGLEVAATARKLGVAVTVLEAAPRLLGRALAPALSDWVAELHRSHGVTLQLGAQVAGIDRVGDQAVAVRLQDGSRWPCGMILVGVGAQANDALAQAAGLDCDRGIVVDACGRTSDPWIVAAGDCTARRLDDGSLRRLESVQNATEQAKSAAAALLGVARPCTATPWFWSDQYDKKLQMAGLSAGADQWVLRGALSDAAFSVCHYRAGQLLAVDSVNHPRDHLAARKLLDQGWSATPAQAADLARALDTGP